MTSNGRLGSILLIKKALFRRCDTLLLNCKQNNVIERSVFCPSTLSFCVTENLEVHLKAKSAGDRLSLCGL